MSDVITAAARPRAYIPRSQRNDWRTPSDVVAVVREVFSRHGIVYRGADYASRA